MKTIFLSTLMALFILGCNKSDLERPPTTPLQGYLTYEATLKNSSIEFKVSDSVSLPMVFEKNPARGDQYVFSFYVQKSKVLGDNRYIADGEKVEFYINTDNLAKKIYTETFSNEILGRHPMKIFPESPYSTGAFKVQKPEDYIKVTIEKIYEYRWNVAGESIIDIYIDGSFEGQFSSSDNSANYNDVLIVRNGRFTAAKLIK